LLSIEDNSFNATAVSVEKGAINITLSNGRYFIAPLRLLPELNDMTDKKLNDVEILEAGRGIMFGDKEAITVLRIIGFDISPIGSL